MKKRKWPKVLISLTLVVVLVIAAMMLLGGGNASITFAEEIAKTSSITTYYSFSGNVEIKNSQNINAEVSATVREVYVSENERVTKGDRLLRLSSGDTIKAGISGEVTKLSVEKDDEVKVGDALVALVDFDHLEIQVKVDEFDVSAIEIGKTAQVTLNALGQTFETVVTGFDKQATKSGDISYYIATLQAPDISGILPGMQVDVKVMNAHAQDVTVISMNALRFDEYNQPYVQTRDASGNTRNTPVKVGATDGIYVEIASGLRSGETVLVAPTATAQAMVGGMGGRMGGMNGNE